MTISGFFWLAGDRAPGGDWVTSSRVVRRLWSKTELKTFVHELGGLMVPSVSLDP